jgi:hypothetical protein
MVRRVLLMRLCLADLFRSSASELCRCARRAAAVLTFFCAAPTTATTPSVRPLAFPYTPCIRLILLLAVSPQGRLHQVEYAQEAVKQGSAVVGLRSATHAVLAALKRAPSELAAHQNKMLRIDNHVGIAFAGLTSDARVLS